MTDVEEDARQTRDRFRGCLLGLAVGDALGAPLEFLPRGSFDPIGGMTGGGVHGLEPGQWTDDTSMALCLAVSLLERDGFDPADQMDRYVRWWRNGYLSCTGTCFDIGNTVRGSLERFVRTGEPFSGPTDPMTAGNGSIMRLAPAVQEIASGSFRRRQPPEIQGAGYVIRSLEAALWAFHGTESFEEGALMAVNLGDDADTTGAVFGQIAGACYGLEGIPGRWVEKVAWKDRILALADRLRTAARPASGPS